MGLVQFVGSPRIIIGMRQCHGFKPLQISPGLATEFSQPDLCSVNGQVLVAIKEPTAWSRLFGRHTSTLSESEKKRGPAQTGMRQPPAADCEAQTACSVNMRHPMRVLSSATRSRNPFGNSSRPKVLASEATTWKTPMELACSS